MRELRTVAAAHGLAGAVAKAEPRKLTETLSEVIQPAFRPAGAAGMYRWWEDGPAEE